MIIDITDEYLNNFYSIDALSYKLVEHGNTLVLVVNLEDNTMLHSYRTAHNNLYNFNIFDVDRGMLRDSMARDGWDLYNLINTIVCGDYEFLSIDKIECSLKKILIDGKYYLKAVINKIYTY